MGDLFCAATLIVAHHGEAEYDEEDLVSDAGGSLTLTGRQQSVELAESVRNRRIAAIWCSDLARAVQTAEIAASTLQVNVRVRGGLREYAVGDWAGQPYRPEMRSVFEVWKAGDLSQGCPGAETGGDIVRRFGAELESLADGSRGETVLVVSHGVAMQLALPRLAGNVPDSYANERGLDYGSVCELAVDADRWVLKSWAGAPVE